MAEIYLGSTPLTGQFTAAYLGGQLLWQQTDFTVSAPAGQDITHTTITGETTATYSITAPAEYVVSNVVVTLADLDAGPVQIAPHYIVGPLADYRAGDTITAQDGVYVRRNDSVTYDTILEIVIGGQTMALPYTIEDGDLTTGIDLRSTAIDDFGSRPYTLNVAGPTAVPVYSVAPTLTGTLENGQTVTATRGTVDAAAETRVEIRIDGQVVAFGDDVVSTDYVILAADVGKTISAWSRARNVNGDWTAWQEASGGVIAGAGGAGYVEAFVSIPAGAYLETATIGSSVPKFLAYVTGKGQPAVRQQAVSFANGILAALFYGLQNRARIQMKTLPLARTVTANSADFVSDASLIRFLITCETETTGIRVRAGAWEDGQPSPVTTCDFFYDGETSMDLAGPVRLFQGVDGSQDFVGETSRVDIWLDPAGTLPNPLIASGWDDFRVADPSIADAKHGQPEVGFVGAASTWNAGTHRGTASFTKSGDPFTDV